jgi:hypothetical protein
LADAGAGNKGESGDEAFGRVTRIANLGDAGASRPFARHRNPLGVTRALGIAYELTSQDTNAFLAA